MSFQFVNPTKIMEKIAGGTTVFQNIMLAYYKPIVKKEVELANVKNTQQVLCVGGGYFPCTAILFHLLSNATVTVIDIDNDAVQYSQKLVKKLGLEDKVIVKHANGLECSGQGFDIVHIAMQVSPKEEVFVNLHGNMNHKCKLLVRTPKQHLERGYQPFSSLISVKDSVKQPSFSNIEKTLLYVR